MQRRLLVTVGLIRRIVSETLEDADEGGDGAVACAEEASGLFPPGVFAWIGHRDESCATLFFKLVPQNPEANSAVERRVGVRSSYSVVPQEVFDIVDDVLSGELGWKRGQGRANRTYPVWQRENMYANVRGTTPTESAGLVWPNEKLFAVEFY